LNAALAQDPAGRPRSAGRLADDLAGALSWTGAAGVRRALAGADGDGAKESGGGQGPGRAERDPAIAAGGDPSVGEEPVVAAVGGTVMRKRRKRTPWRRKQSEVDWTDRALDLGPPDVRAGTEAGDPRAGGTAARERGSAAGGDPIDAALEGGAADEHDAGGDLDLRAGADTLADVAEGLHAGLRDGRGTGPGADEEEAGPDSDAPAADAYSPISVGELESRVEGGGARPASVDEPSEAVPEPRYVTSGGEDEMLAGDPGPEGPEPESSESAETGEVDDDDGEFALTPEEGYDYGLEDEAEPEDATGGIFGRGPADQARRLPVALVAVIGVAVAVTAFVIGLGWMGGSEDDAAAVIADEAGGAGAADDPARAFSEAVVDDAANEPPAPAPAVETGNETPAAAPALRGDTSPAAPPARESSPAVRVSDPETPPPAALPPPAPVDAEGRLLVRSMPPGAEVIVNGESRGTTPLALAELPYGPYEVEVVLAGYPSRREQFMLDADDPIGSLNADLAAAPAAAPAAGGTSAGPPPAEQVGIGSILAETRPPGAAVWLDQRLVGETPVSIPDVPAGARQIEFRLDGYRTWTTTVEVAPATQARVAASLADAAR
ncbi:MAG: PEGA domain-containing protein, partial [Acidobacteria bacterium]|nr:PEGA domain-containing protein [Acidobacteriota bacterium]